MRHLHNELDIYDDDTDTWFRAETHEEALAFVSETGGVQHGLTPEYTPARSMSAWNAPVTGLNTPFKIVSADFGREVINLSYLGTGVLLIGPGEAVRAGQGYGLQGGQQIAIHTVAELWVNIIPGSGSAGSVYCLTEGAAQ